MEPMADGALEPWEVHYPLRAVVNLAGFQPGMFVEELDLIYRIEFDSFCRCSHSRAIIIAGGFTNRRGGLPKLSTPPSRSRDSRDFTRAPLRYPEPMTPTHALASCLRFNSDKGGPRTQKGAVGDERLCHPHPVVARAGGKRTDVRLSGFGRAVISPCEEDRVVRRTPPTR